MRFPTPGDDPANATYWRHRAEEAEAAIARAQALLDRHVRVDSDRVREALEGPG